MLSPHEFATLMLVRSAPDQIDMNRTEVDTLLERQLLLLEQIAGGHQRPSLTPSGHSLLEAASRLPQAHSRSLADCEWGGDEPF
jgi:hypothetical protein